VADQQGAKAALIPDHSLTVVDSILENPEHQIKPAQRTGVRVASFKVAAPFTAHALRRLTSTRESRTGSLGSRG